MDKGGLGWRLASAPFIQSFIQSFPGCLVSACRASHDPGAEDSGRAAHSLMLGEGQAIKNKRMEKCQASALKKIWLVEEVERVGKLLWIGRSGLS